MLCSDWCPSSPRFLPFGPLWLEWLESISLVDEKGEEMVVAPRGMKELCCRFCSNWNVLETLHGFLLGLTSLKCH